MEDNVVLAELTVSPDIEALLDEASRNWLRPSEAYQLGYINGQKQVVSSAKASALIGMIPAAEMFYHLLQKIIPKPDILQHRIGLDYTTGEPTSLTVVSHRHEDKLAEIMAMACDLEDYLFRERGWEYNFWIVTDDGLEQSLVEHDFPYYKKDS